MPVELFKEPAEKLGYIVVGSNNSRNGPWGPIQEAIQALWDDTHARFALDPRRFYTTGMSGGGGPAWILAAFGAAATIICASVLETQRGDPQKRSFCLLRDRRPCGLQLSIPRLGHGDAPEISEARPL